MSHFLLVEDNPATCRIVSIILRRAGHSLECVGRGHEAIELLRQCMLPDAVILDCLLPDLDGINVLKAVRSDPANQGIPIVLYTAVDNATIERAAMAAGATEVWPKGELGPDELVQRLGDLVGAS